MNQASLKIAYLISRYPAVSHTFIQREIDLLRQKGIQILTISVNDPDLPIEKLPAEEQQEAEKTFYIKKRGAWHAIQALCTLFFHAPLKFLNAWLYAIRLGGFDLKAILYNYFYLAEASVVGLWMAQHEINHLHVHFANPAANIALLLSKMTDITYSMTVHGPDEFYNTIGWRLLEKIQNARFITCIGYYAQSQLMKIAPPTEWPKFEISPLGIDINKYAPTRREKEKSDLEILCVGRLVPAKGQFILIAALNLLLKKGHFLHLKLIGSGPEKEELETEIKQRGLQSHVELTGALTQDEVLKAYKNTDIFVLPSFAEGIPISLMEAMAMEIPCISTFVNGIPELIRHEIDGLLTYPSDIEGLVEALDFLIESPEQRQKFGEAGRKRIEEKYLIESNVEQLKEIFLKRLLHD